MKIKIILKKDFDKYKSKGFNKVSLDWWFEKYHIWFCMILLGLFFVLIMVIE